MTESDITAQNAIQAIAIREAVFDDYDKIWTILEPILIEGETYALPRNWNREETINYWTQPGHHHVYVAIANNEIVGTYFLHANQKGNGSHVANCGYASCSKSRGQGVGRAMCYHSIETARAMGFRSMQYNFVISSNTRAVNLWKSFDFEIVGTLNEAFKSPKHGYVDVFVMFRHL